MTARDYSHRSLLDKLGVKVGQAIAVDDHAGLLDAQIVRDIRERAPDVPGDGETLDLVVLTVVAGDDIAALLRIYRDRMKPAGGIWLVTPRRGRPGYIRGDDLIPIGLAERLVDNKVCSVSDHLSGMRFVIRREDRGGVFRTIPT
jgi:hypothetical protein